MAKFGGVGLEAMRGSLSQRGGIERVTGEFSEQSLGKRVVGGAGCPSMSLLAPNSVHVQLRPSSPKRPLFCPPIDTLSS